MPSFLTIAEVIGFHRDQIARYGGSEGIRDLGMLESAIAQPMAAFGGQNLHEDIFEMAAAYLFHIVCNHPFVDGNKRTGLVTAISFLLLNSQAVTASQDEVVAITLAAAEGKAGKREIADFFREHSA